MGRQYQINFETMVKVKGPTGSTISSLSNLGQADSPVTWSTNIGEDDVITDPTGKMNPADVQKFGGTASITMTLVHYDKAVLEECERLSQGGGSAVGTFPRAGTLMGGNGLARFASGNFWVGLNLVAGTSGFRFQTAELASISYPLGTERSVVALTWRAITYVPDPASGLAGAVLWDFTPDT